MKKNNFQNLYILGVVFLLLIIVSYVIYWTSDSSKIRRTINSGRKFVEKKNIDKCLSFFSENYYDSSENSYDDIKEIIEFLFSRISSLKIRIRKINLKIKGDGASAEVYSTVSMTIGKQKIFLSGKDMSPVYLFFKQEGNRWKIISVEGIDFSLKEFL